MAEKEEFLNFIEASLQKLNISRQLAVESQVIEYTLRLHDDAINHFNQLKDLSSNTDLSINYINQFKSEANQILSQFPYGDQNNFQIVGDDQKGQIRENIEGRNIEIEKQLKLIKFNFDFFKKLGFFKNNIVAIGANGSGKTTLSNELKKYLPKHGVVISAQKLLIIPTFSGISNFDSTNIKLQTTQSADKSLRTTYTTESQGNAYGILVQLGGEFQILLDNLLAERSAIRNKFCDSLQGGGVQTVVPKTKLDKALLIWNLLIQHRTIECNDGINITLKSGDSDNYPAYQMSDGEKVTLYLIAQVLQAPPSGFIIVDEPEMYLHKTILKKLWDILEQERQDCIFLYLTHDLDFATSRTISKKVWIRSFKYPSIWEIEDIPENEMPEALLLELLGSRKNILFCEGLKGSIDEKIYNIIYPDYTITPVDSCFDVMTYTKAFNQIPNITIKAFGVIDADHHGIERLSILKEKNVFSFLMAEVENLFLDEDFLKVIAKKVLKGGNEVRLIKEAIILQFEKDIDLQISNYVSAKINYYFKDSHVSKGNSFKEVEENYQKFSDEIKITEWIAERKAKLEEMIRDKDYHKILSVYNNKGLKSITNKYLKITDFTERALKLIQDDQLMHQILLRHFPKELKEASI